MRASIAPSELQDALRQLRPALRRPILGLDVVRLRVLGSQLTVSASGRTMAVDVSVNANDGVDGELFVPAKLFRDTAAHVSDKSCTLASGEGVVGLESSSLRASFRCVAIEAWPELSAGAAAVSAQITGEELDRAITAARAASDDAGRPVLTGLHLGGGWAESTDSMWAIRIRVQVDAPDVVVPADIVSVTETMDGVVELLVGESAVEFRATNVRLACALIASKFPNMDPHFATSAESEVTVERLKLAEAVRSAALFDSSAVSLETVDTGLRVWSKTTAVGELESVLLARGNTMGTKVVSPGNLISALEVATDDEVVLRFTERSFVLLSCSKFDQLVMLRNPA